MSWDIDTSPPPPAAPAPHRPRHPAGGWTRGQTRRQALIACCPECGGPAVAKADNGKSDAAERWACADCRAAWKEPAGIEMQRGKVVKVQ